MPRAPRPPRVTAASAATGPGSLRSVWWPLCCCFTAYATMSFVWQTSANFHLGAVLTRASAPPPPAETLGPPPEKEPGQSLGPAGQDEADPREEASPVAPPHGAGAVLGLVALSSSLLQPALTAVGRGWAGERPLFQLHLLNTGRSGRGRSCRLLTAALSSVWEELTPQQQGTKQLSPGPPRSRDPDTVGSPHPV